MRICCCFQARQELEKIRRRLEAELADLREQLNEKSSQLEELQAQMNKREEELQRALNRFVKPTSEINHFFYFYVSESNC